MYCQYYCATYNYRKQKKFFGASISQQFSIIYGTYKTQHLGKFSGSLNVILFSFIHEIFNLANNFFIFLQTMIVLVTNLEQICQHNVRCISSGHLLTYG